jgi:hypothetical protein
LHTGRDDCAAQARSAPIAGLEFLDTCNRRDVSDVAALHQAWLPTSPVARLGPLFAQRFYYGTLVDDGLVGCSVCKRHGRVVGFTSYSCHPKDLVTRGLKRHPGVLAMILAASVLRAPSRLREILAVVRFLSQRGAQVPPPAEGSGEALSIATDPAHRDYIPPGGTTRMPVRLFDELIDAFRVAGVPRFFAIVEPDNPASRRLFESRGCPAEEITLGGQPRLRYVYRFTREGAG